MKELFDTQIRNAKPKKRQYKLYGGRGLYLIVAPSGGKWWRFRYRLNGKEKTLSLGTYPDVTLKKAEDLRNDLRKLVAAGSDPAALRKAEQVERLEAEKRRADTFETVARTWMARQKVADATARKNKWLMESYIFPEIGHIPIDEVTSGVVRDMLRKVEAAGKTETARRAKIKAGQVFRFGIVEGCVKDDPTQALRGLIKKTEAKHHAALTDPGDIAQLMRAMDGFSGQYVTLQALKLSALVFVRPGELRRAEWPEIDWHDAMWRIPPARMKMKAAHLVPLARQSLEILTDLHKLTGHGRYIFPSIRSDHRPMSENSVNAALRRLGYSGDEMTAHGFRSMAATRLNEDGWTSDAVERQLAHAEQNEVRGAYTAAARYLSERIRMMQYWADYLDKLREGGRVIRLNPSKDKKKSG